jgi:predicted ATPase
MMARLDRSLPVKEIAQIGAAIGREFSYELIAAVAPHTKTELDSALNQFTESGLAFRRGDPPEATYTFKHALVQDAAYDSLLKSRRQELHTKIARVIEEDFPKTKDTEPEVLAHHLTEAHMPEPAIACWSAAAKVAIKRFAHREAVAHLDIALKLVDTLLPTPHRDEQELELRLALANTCIATKGYSAPETEVAYEKAQEVADRLGDVPQIFPIGYGRWVFQLVTGQTAQCHDTARGFFRRAENSSDALVRSVAGRVLGSAALITGNPAHARRLLGEAASLYDPDHHRESGLRYGQDGRVAALANDALAHWYLGFCDQARSRSTEAIAWGRRLNHYQSLNYALFFAINLGCLSRDAVAVRTHGEEYNVLAQQHGAKAHEIWIRAYLAWIPVESGDAAEAIQELEAAIVACAELHIAMHSPWFYTWLATAYGNRGMPDKGIEAARKAVSLVEERGERIHHAEALRVYGTLESIRGDAAAAESRFEEALVIAKAQQAKSWELRAATSLARLWQSQGKIKEARELLAPVYNWFTEGFDTKNLKEAQALLNELKA